MIIAVLAFKVDFLGCSNYNLGVLISANSMTSIQSLVDQAIQEQRLTPEIQAQIGDWSRRHFFSEEDYRILDHLTQALLSGQVRVEFSGQELINVIEILTHLELEAQLDPDSNVNTTDVIAFALNRLPPLYATTAKGFAYLQDYAAQELSQKIREQVGAAIRQVKQSPRPAVV